jgi:hypothetical protein
MMSINSILGISISLIISLKVPSKCDVSVRNRMVNVTIKTFDHNYTVCFRDLAKLNLPMVV